MQYKLQLSFEKDKVLGGKMHTVSETVFINLLLPVHKTSSSLPKHNVQPMKVNLPYSGSQLHYETKVKTWVLLPVLEFMLQYKIHLIYFEIFFKT